MKKNAFPILVVFVFALFSNIVFAQNFIDLVSVGTNQVPSNKYEDSDSTFAFKSNFFDIQYPYIFNDDDVFLTKLAIHNYRIKETTNLDLYNIYMQFGLLKHFNEKTSIRLGVAAKISSELKDVDNNDFVFPMVGVLQFKPKDNFSYGFGFYYSYEFFGNFLNPAIYFKWQISDSWSFLCDFPSHGYLMYQKEKKFNTGIYISSATTSIRLSEKYNNAYIQKAYADFSFFFDIYFTKQIVCRAKAGYSALRALDMFAEKDMVPFTFSVMEFNDERTQLNSPIDDALFFEISLKYRYHY